METIDSLIRYQAGCQDRPALTAPGRGPTSFERLDRLTSEAAAQLRGLGATRTHRLAIALQPGPEAVACLLAVMRQAIAMPLNPGGREAEFQRDLTRLKADCLLVDAASAPAAKAAADKLGIPVIGVVAQPDAPAGTFAFEPGSSLGPSVAWTGQQPDDVALVMQTSGTTGEPKRVPLTHANLMFSARHAAASLRLGPGDCLLGSIAIHHIAGVTQPLMTIGSASGICCAPGPNAARFLDWMDECRPTWIFAAPAVLRKLVEHARQRPDLIERCPLRFIRSGSSAVPPQLLDEAERVFRAPVIEVYGMTEAAPIIACNPLPPRRRKPGSAGLPAGPEVLVLNASGRPAACGESGEVLLRGPNVMRGYEDDPEANRESFWNGWFRTGDLGWLDEEGYLFLNGRLREMINRGGQKVSPVEVEDALARHAGVREAAVFPVPHQELGEEVAAAVVSNPGVDVTERDLRQFAAATLAGYKVPARIVFVPEIPRSSGGKLRRLELARELGPLLARESRPAKNAFVPPATPVEKELARIWQEVLAVENIGIHDDFFALGGDSFSAAVLLAAVQAKFVLASGDLERIDFLEAPTIAAMARMIESSVPVGQCPPAPCADLPLIALQPQGSGAPFFFAPGVDEDPFYLLLLAHHLGPARPFYLLRDPAPAEQRRDYSLTGVAALFASAMRKVQPRGPYLIGGHCLGGVIAFETARQLRAAGDEVALLVVVDAPAPHYLTPGRHWRIWLASILRRTGLHLRHRISRAERAADWRFVRAASASLGRRLCTWPRRRPDTAPPADEMNIRQINLRALRQYRAQVYPGRLVTLDAKDDPEFGAALDWRLGWSDLAAGGIERHVLNGTHGTIVEGPFAPETAAVLNGLIRKAVESAELPKDDPSCVPA